MVRIHVTFLLFLVWIGAAQWRVGGREAALEGLVFLVLIFTCVLAHEFGHIFAARRYGIRTPEVTLWPNSNEHVPKLTGGLSPEATEKILSGNAARVYGV